MTGRLSCQTGKIPVPLNADLAGSQRWQGPHSLLLPLSFLLILLVFCFVRTTVSLLFQKSAMMYVITGAKNNHGLVSV